MSKITLACAKIGGISCHCMNRVLGSIFDLVWQAKKTYTGLTISSKIKHTSSLASRWMAHSCFINSYCLDLKRCGFFYFHPCLLSVTSGKTKTFIFPILLQDMID